MVLNMADTRLSSTIAVSKISEITNTGNRSTFTCAFQVKQELCELLSEIKSLRKTQINDQKNEVLSDIIPLNECVKCHEFSRILQTTTEELKSTQLNVKMLYDEINQLNTLSHSNTNEQLCDKKSLANEWSIVKHKHSQKTCKSMACASDNINNISLMNKYEILSEHSDLKTGQEKIPVIVGGRIMKVNSTHVNQV
jgi:hypothetical protein